MDKAMDSKSVTCSVSATPGWESELYTSGVRNTQFLERLAQVLKVAKNAACQRAIGRLLASMKKRYEDGEYESPSEAESAFRRLVDEECQK